MSQSTFVVRGVHPYPATAKLLADTLVWQYGDNLSADERKAAEERVREHLASVYLLEVSGEDLTRRFEWGKITQEIPSLPRAQWQVPYEERPLDEGRSRWAFFFHYLRPDEPLLTPYGPVPLPTPTPLPAHLREVVYEAP